MRASELTFGFELETGIPSKYQRLIRTHGYRGGGEYEGPAGVELPKLPGWRVDRDGSLDAPDSCYAVEIVSPVLSGESGLIEAFRGLDLLSQAGVRSNRSMGLHVHVGAAHLGESEVTHLADVFPQYEAGFFGLCGEAIDQRWNADWCRRHPNWSGRHHDFSERYRSLNLMNWHHNRSKKTVEFRLFASRNDPLYVLAAIQLCVGFVAGAPAMPPVVGRRGEGASSDPVVCVERFIEDFMDDEWNRIVPDDDNADILAVACSLATTGRDTLLRRGRI